MEVLRGELKAILKFSVTSYVCTKLPAQSGCVDPALELIKNYAYAAQRGPAARAPAQSPKHQTIAAECF